MYNLDINFLKDRGLDAVSRQKVKSPGSSQPVQTKIPFIIGGIVAVVLPALAFAYLMLVNNQKTATQDEINQLTTEISQLQSENSKVQSLQTQLQQVDAELNSLVSVFNQIKPFSVILQDIKEKIPLGVQINSIQQSQVMPPAAQGQATTPEPPKQGLTITGYALSFADVNDFLLTLQTSDFLNPKKTVITSANLEDFPISDVSEEQRKNIIKDLKEGNLKDWPSQLRRPENWQGGNQGQSAKDKLSLPKVVKFTIKTEFGDKPASELTTELREKGAVGLINRIKSLQEKGAISQ